MSEEMTEAKFWRDRFYQVSVTNEKSMEIIKLLMERANKKEWVGLTEDEKQFFKAMGFSGIDIVEAKLKEKNT